MYYVKRRSVADWILRLVSVVILLQTLYFKFSAAEESVYIFSILGMEPWGRIGTGVMELIASILILYNRTTVFGSLLALGLMTGALFFHLTTLGIEVEGDGGLLFLYAVLTFFASITLVWIHRAQLLPLINLKTSLPS